MIVSWNPVHKISYFYFMKLSFNESLRTIITINFTLKNPCIQLFMNTCKVTMQVKRVIGKPILNKLPIYHEFCLCWVSTLYYNNCKFFNCIKRSHTRLRSLYLTFYLCCKCATVLCAHTQRRSIKMCLL